MCFRFAVRAVEAWLIADRLALADQLHVAPERLPAEPDRVPDPKRCIIEAARRSRSQSVRSGLLPRPGSGRTEGPDYADSIETFARTAWDPARAARESDSLARCRRRLLLLRDLVAGMEPDR
jgi:hypothetical protein